MVSNVNVSIFIFQLVVAALSLKLSNEAKPLKKDTIKDEVLNRKLNKVAMVGTSQLPKDKLGR